MYARGGKKKPILTSINNAAVESGFYTITGESGEKSQAIERLLSLIEGGGREAIDRISEGVFPPDPDSRDSLALFMAFQMLRTPERRREYEEMVDYTSKTMLEGWTPEYARQRLQQEGIEPTEEAVAEIMEVVENPNDFRFVPHQNEQIRLMLDVAVKVAPVIAGRTWLLGHCRVATFVTGDHPVVWYSRPTETSRYRGVGVGNAEEVYYPLDRHHVLLLALPGVMRDGMVAQLSKDNALFVNSAIAAFSHRWVYQHPDDDRVDYLIPHDPKVLVEINGKPVFD
jgi:hypothetical protein